MNNSYDQMALSGQTAWIYNATQPAGNVEWVKGAGHALNPAFKITSTAGGQAAVIPEFLWSHAR